MASLLNKTRSSPYKADWEKDVVYLYQFPRPETIPTMSPYCIKLETWLRMMDINYENVDCPVWIKSGEGMLPFIELNGEEHGDSAFIMELLMDKFGKKDSEAHLSPAELAAARAFATLVESSAWQSYARIRYCEKADEMMSEKMLGPRMAGQIPWIYRYLMPGMMKRGVTKSLQGHGIGKHGMDDIVAIGLKDLDALDAYIGEKDYLTDMCRRDPWNIEIGYPDIGRCAERSCEERRAGFWTRGAKPIRADTAIFGLLSQLVYLPLETPHTIHVKKNCPRLLAHTERIRAAFWPDWDECCRTGSLHTVWRKK